MEFNMIPINNSDTAWLIVADWNQDNGKYHEELREDVNNPDINQWSWQLFDDGVGGKIEVVSSGDKTAGSIGYSTVGDIANNFNNFGFLEIGGVRAGSKMVGTNYHIGNDEVGKE
jgi:hypothetical protein